MPRLLVLLQSAFSVWMLVDAIGRPGIPRYWYWVILMPFGEWFYFFKYKIHDPDFAWLKAPFGSLLDRLASIQELRHNAEQTPSLANQVSWLRPSTTRTNMRRRPSSSNERSRWIPIRAPSTD